MTVWTPSLLSLDQTFDRFIDEIALRPDEVMAARAVAARVSATVHAALGRDPDGVPDPLVSGGVGKRTAIHPLSAVDLLYPVSATDTPVGVLQDTLACLFSDVVAVTDGFLLTLDSITICLRPSVERQGLYAIPAPGGWVNSNPLAEMAALRVADSISGGRTTRLLLLLKAWKATCAVSVPSFALELMAREFLSECGDRPQTSAWAGALTDFLAWCRQRTQFDLPGGGERLTIDARWHPQAESAYWRCVLASRHQASGEAREAVATWRQLFGPRFAAPRRFNMWTIRPDLGPDHSEDDRP